jgi:C1A family cysteine protease
MRLLSSLPALAALLLASTTKISALEVSTQIVCTQQGINDCAALNRLCRIVENDRETCPVCLQGYIGFLREDLINTECILVSSIDLDKLRLFIQEYGAVFKERVSQLTQEERLQLFIKVADFISQHNAQDPPPSYELGLTPWSMDTEADGRERAGFIFVPPDGIENELPPVPEATSVNVQGSQLPDRVDWVEEGAVTFVKDQGRCGCCWAVSVSGAIEGAAAINARQNGYEYVQSLSFQQLISCADKNYGCGGGDLVLAMKYALSNEHGGITRLNDYSYTDYEGSTTKECMVQDYPLAVIPEGGQVVLDFFDTSLSFQERLLQMKTTLAKQPISSVIRSNCGTLSSYKKGILTDDGDCACANPSCIDHAILLVGYDDTSDPPNFKLKNSWGTSWGEDGYFRIAQTPANGAYGLFGMLSHGVIPDIAYNVTLQVEDEEPETLTDVPWWGSLLILLAAICCCCGCIAIVKNKMDAKKRAAKRQTKQQSHKKHKGRHDHDDDEEEQHKEEGATEEESPW